MKITIETIPHDCQRYDTVGDWVFEPDGSLNINVSKLSDERSEIAVAIHELVEAILCKDVGITAEGVDAFDMHWPASSMETMDGLSIEEIRKKYEEPGRDPSAPYYSQHIEAERIERKICRLLGLSWDEHCKVVDNA